MTGAALLMDNDVVIKLVQIDAYREGVESVDAKPNQVGSIEPMLAFMVRAATTSSLRLKEQEQSRLLAVLRTITEVDVTVEEGNLAAKMMKSIILAELDIQEGELILMAIGILRTDYRIATGDKRALRELPRLSAACPELASLKGRLICFEQIIKRICQRHGLPRVRTAILSARHADARITKLYDSMSPGGSEAFRQGLTTEAAAIAPGWLAKI